MKKILFFLCLLLESNLGFSQGITINAQTLQDTKIRKANFSGSFYEQDKEKLNSQISSWIKEPIINEKGTIPPQTGLNAIIVPHAGYEYSGKLAAQTFMFANQSKKFKKIFLIGQPHRVSFPGIIIDKSEQWETPLGNIDLDLETINMLSSLPYIKKDSFNNLAFSTEHSLEVQTSLIKTIFPEAKIIPILIGRTDIKTAADIIMRALNTPEALTVISTDLSHYLSYKDAKEKDAITAKNILSFNYQGIKETDACASLALKGFLLAAKTKEMESLQLFLKNSWDTSGLNKEKVVGYGAFGFISANKNFLSAQDEYNQKLIAKYGEEMLKIAVQSITNGLEKNRPLPIELKSYPAVFSSKLATFVTLNKNKDLRGCIGSLSKYQPLGQDISNNAFSAAFKDARFNPLTSEEIKDLDITISLLTDPLEISFTNEVDLISKLTPNIDGVILEEKNKKALYLPSVWQQIPNPSDFIANLKIKAGLNKDYWSSDIKIKIFKSRSISLSSQKNPLKYWGDIISPKTKSKN